MLLTRKNSIQINPRLSYKLHGNINSFPSAPLWKIGINFRMPTLSIKLTVIGLTVLTYWFNVTLNGAKLIPQHFLMQTRWQQLSVKNWFVCFWQLFYFSALLLLTHGLKLVWNFARKRDIKFTVIIDSPFVQYASFL